MEEKDIEEYELSKIIKSAKDCNARLFSLEMYKIFDKSLEVSPKLKYEAIRGALEFRKCTCASSE